MTTPPLPGTPAQQALLGAIVEACAGDQRVLAVGIVGSLARGTADEWSDLDLDVVVADDVVLDAVAEAHALCELLGHADALVLPSRPGEVDVVLPTLEQFSIRYHRPGTTNAHIVDDLQILGGRLDRAAVLAAGVVHSLPVRPMELIASEALRLALSVDTAIRRGHLWQALRGLDELRWRLEELFAASRGLARPAHALDSHASPDLQRKLGGLLAEASRRSVASALANALELIDNQALTTSQWTLSRPQQAVLRAIRKRTSMRGADASASRPTSQPQPLSFGRTHMHSSFTPARSPRAVDWPALPVDTWPDTQATLHRWVQIVGKLRLELSPPQNHYWHSTLYVSPHGLTTSSIPYGADLFQVDFDFLQHQLLIDTSWARSAAVALRPRSVADFYAEVMDALRDLGIQAHIWTTPVEVADTTPFEDDTAHAGYDPLAVQAYWRALLQADRVFKQFRAGFLGKSSPVHFFWGSFDLAVTRFSGRLAPMWDGPVLNVNPHVMHESYSHELSSAGFWPGDASAPALFYSYAVPQPAGFQDAPIAPAAASYNTQMGEFVLPYELVRTSEQPDADLTRFLETTYAAAADLGGWDRALLEQRPRCMCDVRDLRRASQP